jgi:antitoxin Phd
MARSPRKKETARWALQDAKNRLSEVVDAALGGEPQVVTRRGVETAVLISHAEFERMSGQAAGARPSLSEHLLALPASEDEDSFDRIQLRPRDLHA